MKRYVLSEEVPEPLSHLAMQRMRQVPVGQEREDLHMRTESFGRIRFELLRYCRGEIDGLSILIAGQRGAGKTTLAKMTIQEVMYDSKAFIPLPIMLHGPTILDLNAAFGSSVRLRYLDAQNPYGKNAQKEKEHALRQLTTALYRSLCGAIYDGWKNAAAEAPSARRSTQELLALRAHLSLRLDRAPDPDVLRKIWERAGFLHTGVAYYLRPIVRNPISGALERNVKDYAGNDHDQGVREIVALASLADAYRVILGEASETLQSKGETTREAESEAVKIPSGQGASKGKEENKAQTPSETFGPPLVGTIAGLLTAGDMSDPRRTVLGLAIGLALWLFGSVAISHAKRTARQAVSRELNLRIKWDVSAIERDFPILLRRIKDAGFAPIFVLDELDKVSDAMATLNKFLRLAKHLVTEHAAFMFLTNRDYYEELLSMEQLDAEALR